LKWSLHKLKHFLPGFFGLPALESAAGGQNDLDAHFARPDGIVHVVKDRPGRYAASRRPASCSGLKSSGFAIGVDFVNENGSATRSTPSLKPPSPAL